MKGHIFDIGYWTAHQPKPMERKNTKHKEATLI